MKPRICICPVMCGCILLLLSGCMTQRVALQVSDTDKPLKIVRTENLILTVRFLDDDTLRQKFGKETNPYISDYYSVQFRRFMVFEFSIENTGSAPIKFQLNRLEMQFGGTYTFPYNQFRINQYWGFKDEEGEIRAGQKARREKYVKEYVLPDSATIPAPGRLRGYAVFTGDTPNYGTATLYVPIFTPAGKPLHRFEVSFEF